MAIPKTLKPIAADKAQALIMKHRALGRFADVLGLRLWK